MLFRLASGQPPNAQGHLDGGHAGREAQAGVVAVRHDDAAHHARGHAPAALVHVHLQPAAQLTHSPARRCATAPSCSLLSPTQLTAAARQVCVCRTGQPLYLLSRLVEELRLEGTGEVVAQVVRRPCL
jgi:hypothetical protein